MICGGHTHKTTHRCYYNSRHGPPRAGLFFCCMIEHARKRRVKRSTRARWGRMLLASSFSYICSAAATALSAAVTVPCTPSYPAASLVRHLSSSSTFSSSSIPRALAAAAGSGRGGRATRRGIAPGRGSAGGTTCGGNSLFSASSAAEGSGGTAATPSSAAAAVASSGMVPDDAATLLRAVYAAKPTPQVCVTTTG